MKNVFASAFLFFACFCVIVGTGALEGKNEFSRPNADEVEKIIKKKSLIGFEWVDQPINKILLIKQGGNYCAIKFLSYSRARDKREPTIFSANEESFSGNAVFVESKKGKPGKAKELRLTRKSPIGIAKIAYSSSNDILRCGKSRLMWLYPTGMVSLSVNPKASFAPTANEDFNELNFNSTNLRWYSYDESRKMELIPISELPIAQ